MTEIQRIQDQLKKSFEGESWHGPAVREALAGVTAAQAARRPIAGAHTIWEIALHMATWKTIVMRRLSGEPVTDVAPEVDWPPVRAVGEAAWQAALHGLEQVQAELRQALAQVRDDQLDQPPAKGTSTRYVLLHGIIQHDLYHAGQIAVLKKG